MGLTSLISFLFFCRFEIAIFVLIFLNMLTMGIEHYNQPHAIFFILEVSNAFFTTVFGLGMYCITVTPYRNGMKIQIHKRETEFYLKIIIVLFCYFFRKLVFFKICFSAVT